MITFSVILISFYVLLISGFLVGWKNIKPAHSTILNQSANTAISLVIAFRNEEAAIPALLDSISKQTYPHQLLEIIFVNDHSTDSSTDIISRHAPAAVNMQVLMLPPGKTGKKDAIAMGIKQARGPLVATTDADCRFGENWLKQLAISYISKPTDLIFGPVIMEAGDNFLSYFQKVEFASLVASAAGAAGIGHPILCNAANMAIKKSTWLKVYESVNNKHPSGDDVFLLLAIKKQGADRIRFLKSKEAMVVTRGENSLRKFFGQRIRWAAKSRSYTDTDIIVTSFTVLLTNLWMLFLAGLSPFLPNTFFVLAVFFLLKSLMDYTFLQTIAPFFNLRKLWITIIPLQIIYILYVPFTALAGFLGKFTWKDRQYKPSGHE